MFIIYGLKVLIIMQICVAAVKTSVTRLGDLLDFGQFFKAFGNNQICPISPTIFGNFWKAVKIFNFSSEIIFGNFYRYLATFYWSHWSQLAGGRNKYADNKK